MTVPQVTTPSVSKPSLPSVPTSLPGAGSTSSGVTGAVTHASVPSTATRGAVTGSPASTATYGASGQGASSTDQSWGGTGSAGSRAALARDGGGRNRARGGAHRAAPLTQRQLSQLVQRLNGCLASVTPRQRQLLTLRTGYGLQRTYNRAQVARILRVSQSREGQIEQAAVAGLQQASQHSNCGSASHSLSAIAITVARTPFEIIQRVLGPGQSPPTTTSAGGSRAASSKRQTAPRHVGSPQPPQTQGVNPAGPPGKSAVISPPAGGGTDWVLLAAAIASLGAAAAAVAARRRSQHARLAGGPAPAALESSTRRPRLSPLVGAVAGLPARVPGRVRRRALTKDSEAPRALLDPPAAPEPLPVLPDANSKPQVKPEIMPPAPVTPPAAATPALPVTPPAAATPPPPAAPPVADAGRAEAMAAFALASTLEREHDLRGAEEAYRRADELGHPEASFHLGGMLAEQGDVNGALALYRRADELGHAAGAFNLGVLLEHMHDRAGAEAAYRRSDGRGSALAAFNLGVMLQGRGEFDAAAGRLRPRG